MQRTFLSYLGVAAVGLATFLCALLLTAAARAEPLRLYVSPSGNDTWSGTLPQVNQSGNDGPFRSLERARDELRKRRAARLIPAGGAEVELQAGIYELTTAFGLGADDSGSAECPVIFRAQPNAEVRLVGGKVIANWQPVTDPAVLKRMDPSARDRVLQADLKAHGVADLGVMVPGRTWGASDPGLEVFFADQPMTLARYPNEGYTTIPEVFGKTPQDIRGTRGCMEGIIGYEGDRPERWVGEKDVMLEGYW